MNLPDPLIASNDRQLFVDNHLIDSLRTRAYSPAHAQPARNVSHAQSPLGR